MSASIVSFSGYKRVLSDRRRRLTVEHLKMNLVMQYSLQRDSDSAQPLSSAHPTPVIIDVEETDSEEDNDD